MTKLLLDTTTAKEAKVSLFRDNREFLSVQTDSPLTAIEKALEEASLKLSEIDTFEANPGPGSYTGIRVGLAVINSLNWALNKKSSPQDPKYQ